MFSAVALAVLTVLPGNAISSIAVSHPGITSQHVTVRSGNTLSGLSVRYCHGNASDWTGIYHQNAKTIGNDPNLIFPGQVLAITKCTHADPPGYTPAGRPLHSAAGKTGGYSSASSAYSAFPGAACIVSRESGGNATAQNPYSSASGLFQDLSTTWNNYDGYPAAKDAPVSVQIQFNQRLAATAGLSPWAADGCPGT